MAVTVSSTSLREMHDCNRAWYLHRVLKCKGSPQLHFIVGSAVHDFVAYWLHRPTKKEPRTFFYKTQESMFRAFKRYWCTKVWLSEYDDIFPEELKWWAYNKAEDNLANYWGVAEGRGRPTHLEKRLSLYVPELGCKLVGIIDQIRPTNPRWAAQQGILNPRVVFADLKTGFPQYWSDSPYSTEKDQFRVQTALVNSIQPTFYYFLNWKIEKYLPDSFLYWFLGGETCLIVPTTRTKKDFEELFNHIRIYMERISRVDIEDFPKTANEYTCKRCQYWEQCWQDRPRPEISIPVDYKYGVRPSGVSVAKVYTGRQEYQPSFKMPGTRVRKPTQEERQVEEVRRYNTMMNGE